MPAGPTIDTSRARFSRTVAWYRSFKSALDRGATCAELFDQREHFDDEGTLAKVDRDLAEIGCTSRDSVRDD